MAEEPTGRVREVILHGHRVSFREAGGRGPVVLLLHGVAGSSATWDQVIPLLAPHARVVAPDLLGHGESAKPRGDYSLGAYASGVRDLLGLLGVDQVTVVGHSLGGGVAMQFAYQFFDRCERMVLVSSGGLGREVTPLLRAATLPGSELVLPVLANRRLRGAGAAVGRLVTRYTPLRPTEGLAELARGYASLADTEARSAFVLTLRAVLDAGGQRVNGTDRLYLAADLPTLLVWGERDRFIPVSHAHAAHRAIPGSRLVVFPDAGHFPHREQPQRFATTLLDFLASTAPARLDEESLRHRLARGA